MVENHVISELLWWERVSLASPCQWQPVTRIKMLALNVSATQIHSHLYMSFHMYHIVISAWFMLSRGLIKNTYFCHHKLVKNSGLWFDSLLDCNSATTTSTILYVSQVINM